MLQNQLIHKWQSQRRLDRRKAWERRGRMKINECAHRLGEGGWGQKSAGVSLQMARTGRSIGETERDGTDFKSVLPA